MPELPEIHRYADQINLWVSNERFSSTIKEPTGKGPDLFVTNDFSIFAKARGKEIQLTLSPDVGSSLQVVFRHGLVGSWAWESVKPKYTHIYFVSKSGKKLCFVDSNRLGTWNIGTFDRTSRGPDPISEFNEFRDNILRFSKTAAFQKQICEVLLNQKFFNGIGNYLRAEILHRACISPFVKASELFHSNPEAANILIALCRNIPLEVLELGLNKYGTLDEISKFNKWLRVYDKGQFETVAGRKIFYTKDQHLKQPEQIDTHVPLSKNPKLNNTLTKPQTAPFSRDTLNSKPTKSLSCTPKEKNLKLLLLSSTLLYNQQKISAQVKSWMKNCAIQRHDMIYCALEAFLADEGKDLDEYADTVTRMFELANSSESYLW